MNYRFFKNAALLAAFVGGVFFVTSCSKEDFSTDLDNRSTGTVHAPDSSTARPLPYNIFETGVFTTTASYGGTNGPGCYHVQVNVYYTLNGQTTLLESEWIDTGSGCNRITTNNCDGLSGDVNYLDGISLGSDYDDPPCVKKIWTLRPETYTDFLKQRHTLVGF